MNEKKEELASDLVWRYVERVRDSRDAALSRGELQSLVDVLETAGRLPDVLEATACPVRREAVRRRVSEALGTAPQPAAAPRRAEPAARPDTAPAPSLPLWRMRASLALIAALALALVTVPLWHRPPVQVRERSVPRDVSDVRPMSESRAAELIPRLVRNEHLDRQEERNLFWHLLVCPGCFESYVRLKESRPIAAGPRSPRWTTASYP